MIEPLDHFLPNLVKKVQNNDECYEKARELFKNELSYIRLEGPFNDDYRGSNENSIGFKYMVDINNAFDFFGDLVTHVDVDFENISVDHGKEIIERINNHCTSLTTLHLQNCHGDMLDYLNGTLPTITSFQFSTHPTQKLSIKPDNKKLHEIIPNVLFLDIGNMKVYDEWMYIGGIHAKATIVGLYEELDEPNESHLIEFLQHNPQVMGLEIHFANRRLLSKLNYRVPNFVYLNLVGISQNYSNYDKIHVNGVTMFKFTSKSEDEIPDKIDLHQINELILENPFNFSNKWIDFLKNQVNPHLNKLRVKTNSLKLEQLLAIVKNLPKLEEVHIDVRSNVAINGIVEFLKNGNKLKRLRLYSYSSESEAKKLVEMLAGQWNVKYDVLYENHFATTIER